MKFDDDLGVFYLRTKEELPDPTSCYIPQLPAEIWCLIGQCSNYLLEFKLDRIEIHVAACAMGII